MDRQTLILTTVLTVLVTLTGLHMVFTETSGVTSETESFENITVNGDQSVATASFYNRSIDLMYEDSEAAKMYLDYDQDGSFDHRLEIVRDGEIRKTSRTVSLDGREFALYFTYRDSDNRTDDGRLTLYKVKAL